MATYTSALGLYKPNRNDSLALDTTLADNFQKIDDILGSGLTDSLGNKFDTLKDRLIQLEQRSASLNYVIATDSANVKADGVNDDTAGIQALLDRAIDNDGVRVVFPAGTYVLRAPLRVKQGTYIDAQKGAVFMKKHNGAFLLNLMDNDQMVLYNGNGNIVIKGGRWNANYPAYTGGTSFVFAHADGLLFEDVQITDHGGGHAMEINACRNVAVRGCNFNGFDDLNGTRNYSEAIQLDLAKSSGVFPWGGSVFDNTPCQDIWIDGNRFTSQGDRTGWGRAVGSHSATTGRWQERIFITNNIIHETLTWAIRAYSWRDVVIANNIMENCGGGISIDPNSIDGIDDQDSNGNVTGQSNLVERVLIQGNIIRGGGSYGSGISVGGDAFQQMIDVQITNNMIDEYAGTYGIFVTRLAQSMVNDNSLVGVKTGIKISDTWMMVVTGNLIRSASGSGIEAFTPNGALTISGNGLHFVRGHGVWLSGNDTTAVTNNMFNGIGALADGSDFNGIRATSSCDRLTITGNTFRNFGSTYAMSDAIYTNSTTTNTLVAVNNGAGIGMALYAGNNVEYGNLK